MQINVKMSTIDGILTFIIMINTTSDSFKARKTLLYFDIVTFAGTFTG